MRADGRGGAWRAARRRRGGTFTIVALATSTALLALGSLHLPNATLALRATGERARRAAAREGAFAGLRWATHDAGRPGEAAGAGEGRGVLVLEGARVEVTWRRADDLLLATSAATGRLGERVVLTGTHTWRDGRWRLETFARD